MLRSVSQKRRVLVYLLALFLLGGMCWLDTFDLSDDIPLPLPLTVMQQAIVFAEENREDLLGLMYGHQGIWFVTPFIPQSPRFPISTVLSVSPQSEPPLYQRFSTYRI